MHYHSRYGPWGWSSHGWRLHGRLFSRQQQHPQQLAPKSSRCLSIRTTRHGMPVTLARVTSRIRHVRVHPVPIAHESSIHNIKYNDEWTHVPVVLLSKLKSRIRQVPYLAFVCKGLAVSVTTWPYLRGRPKGLDPSLPRIYTKVFKTVLSLNLAYENIENYFLIKNKLNYFGPPPPENYF